MIRSLIRFASALVIAAMSAVFAAQMIGDAQPPRVWLTWFDSPDYPQSDAYQLFLSDGIRIINISQNYLSPQSPPAWSVDGRLAWIAGDVVILDGGRIQRVTYNDCPREYTFWMEFIAWSNEGQLAWQAGEDPHRTLCVWDGERAHVVSEIPDGYFMRAMWTAEGDLIWYAPAVEGEMIQVWDGETVRVIEEMADENQFWSDSGAPVWVSHEGGDQSVRMWDGTQVITLHNGGMWDSMYAWSADGRLAWIDDHGEIKVWDGDRVQIVPSLERTSVVPHFPLVWSPDGRLTWIAQVNLTSQLVIAVWAGETSFQMVETAGDSVYPTWSADGRLAWVTSDYPNPEQLHMWDGSTIRSVDLPGTLLEPPSWSADGRLTVTLDTVERTLFLVWDGTALTTLGMNGVTYRHWSPPIN